MNGLLQRPLRWLALGGLAALLALSGCGSSSSPTPRVPTGSWEGTIIDPTGSSHPVVAIFAPGTGYRITFTDRTQVVYGDVSVVENIGSGTVTNVLDSGTGPVKTVGRIRFVLPADNVLTGYLDFSGVRWSMSLQGTALARRATQQADLSGGWSNLTDHLNSQLNISGTGTIAGNGSECSYSGTAKQIKGQWNIFQIDLTIDCPNPLDQSRDGHYTGLGMIRDSASGLEFVQILSPFNTSWLKVLSTTWYATVNQPPSADAGPGGTRNVLSNHAVTLDGRASSDPNGDLLSYSWTVVSTPGGIPLTLTNPLTAQPSFVPPVIGDYSFRLTVSDGQSSDQADVTMTIAFAPSRFVDQGDGTVLDNTTGLTWLRNANCLGLRTSDQAAADVLGIASGTCGLSDGSLAGIWRLPTRNELLSLLDTGYSNPALSNTLGDGHWSSGDPFVNVMSAPYWTGDGDLAGGTDGSGNYLLFYYVNLDNGASSSMAWNNVNYFWPVRITGNVAPLVRPGSGGNRSVLFGTAIPLDGSASSDPNGDPLSFSWAAVSYPGATAPALSNAGTATPSFVPTSSGDYTFRLTVSDGVLSSQGTVTLSVVVLPRFSDMGNGTVLDNASHLLWLKDAGCLVAQDVTTAFNTVAGLTNGQCGLTDGSPINSWHLPLRSELLSVLDSDFSNPALSDARGDGPWSSGDAFLNVISAPYWSGNCDPAAGTDGYGNCYNFFDVNLADGSSSSAVRSTLKRVWAVRNWQP